MSLECEPSSEPSHVSAKQLYLNTCALYPNVDISAMHPKVDNTGQMQGDLIMSVPLSCLLWNDLVHRHRPEKDCFIDNVLVRIHFMFELIWWTGLAPWEFDFSFQGSLTSTFLEGIVHLVPLPSLCFILYTCASRYRLVSSTRPSILPYLACG